MAQTVYRVLEGCPAGQLEEQLNALAAEGWDLREIFPSAAAKQGGYDVILTRRRDSSAAAGFHIPRP